MRRVIGNSTQETIARMTQKPTNFTSRMTMVNCKSFTRSIVADSTNAILCLKQLFVLFKSNAKFTFEGISSCAVLKFRSVLNAIITLFVLGFNAFLMLPIIFLLLSQEVFSFFAVVLSHLRSKLKSAGFPIRAFISSSTFFTYRLPKSFGFDFPTKANFRFISIALSTNHNSIIAYSLNSQIKQEVL